MLQFNKRWQGLVRKQRKGYNTQNIVVINLDKHVEARYLEYNSAIFQVFSVIIVSNVDKSEVERL